jgi:carbamoyl-phosphate synthase large subunit
MPLKSEPVRVLVIGPGPVRIGHGSELDFAAFTAAAALKKSGFDVLSIDANPAGLLTHASRAYVAPVSYESIVDIIKAEKPGFLLPTFGGSPALSLALRLYSGGALEGTEIMGLDIDTVKTISDRMLLKEKLSGLGVHMPKSALCLSIDEAERNASAFGYPVVVRPAVTGVGRISLVYNVEVLRLIAASITGASSPVMVEESLSGWEKLETEVLSDKNGNAVTVVFRENLDQMGIHSGDTVAVIPLQTVEAGIREMMDDISTMLARELGIKGTANIQFGYDRQTGKLLVLEINPRYSRSTAFASAATGVNLAEASSRCAAGFTLKDQNLDKLPNLTRTAVRMPVFQFGKFEGADNRLNTRMLSTGASIGIGRNFSEAFQNAAKSQVIESEKEYAGFEKDELCQLLSEPTGSRFAIIMQLLGKGVEPAEISELTKIKPFFIEKMKDNAAPQAAGIKKQPVQPGEGPVIIICSGPSRIGEGQELSAMSFEAADAAKSLGFDVVSVDSNPYGTASIPGPGTDAIISPLDFESIAGICRERSARGVICQTGGVHAQKIAAMLETAGMKIFGTSPEKAFRAESRQGLAGIAREAGISIPQALLAGNISEMMSAAEKIGFPVIILPETETPDGRSNAIASDFEALEHHARKALFPVYVEKFLEGGFMAQVDAVCDGTEAFIPSIVEHVEHAGIHTGDAACVVPPLNISNKNIAEMRDSVSLISRHLGVRGFLNAQFAVHGGSVYCLGISLRASRTVPLVSKVSGIPMVDYAVRAMFGTKIRDMGITEPELKHYGVREAVFSFDVFTGVDPLLGPEMRSTGQSLGMADNFGLAFSRSLEAAGTRLPDKGRVLITVSRNDRHQLLDIAQSLKTLGFEISATKGTARFLGENDIKARTVLKVYEGRPNIVDDIKNGEYSLIINTPSGRLSRYDDSYIRKAAITYKVPYVTTMAGAIAAIKGIKASRIASAPMKPLESSREFSNK